MSRAFFYVQHLLGIGHLVRANRIGSALVDAGFHVTVAMGGVPVPGLLDARFTVIQLPPIRAGSGGFSDLEDAQGRALDEAFKLLRAETLRAAFAAADPDVLLIEAFPFGRRALRFELVPLLAEARNLPRRPLVAASVRDILQASGKPGRAEETVRTIEDYFDLVLVHGDPRFAQLGESFPLAAAIGGKVMYTGLVAGPLPPMPAERYDVVVSAGGGAAGLPVIRAASEVMRRGRLKARCCLVTGPNLAAEERRRLASQAIDGLQVFPFRADLPSLFRGAKTSVSQAGYNTVCDLLQARCNALLVPFAAGGETEQSARAARLAGLGLATVIAEDDLTADRLEAALAELLGRAPPPPSGFDLDGAARSAAILRDRLALA